MNDEPLPLWGEWVDPDPASGSLLECDGLAEFISLPTQPLPDDAPLWHRQQWFEHLCDGPNAMWRHCREWPGPSPVAGEYFLLGLEGAERQGDPTIVAEREWTPDLERERDQRIREAWRKIRERELTRGLPGNPSTDDLDRHIHGGIQGDKGEIRPADGRTWPEGGPDPETGKGKSTMTLNGDAVLDADPEQLVALLLHELVHVAQNMDGKVPKDLKFIAIDRIEREVGAYDLIWTKMRDGQLQLRDGLQAREAMEATQAIVDLFRKFADIVKMQENAPTPEQRDAIRAMRRHIRELLLRYQQFLATMPALALAALITLGPDGKTMNAKELVDYLLQHTF
ncbi:hypothetical protein [Arenimonas sp.]|uniref:hypothetical protein n=1 Tax=Arenimonas sp. TaxID=1872635 RepID=UPI0039E31474